MIKRIIGQRRYQPLYKRRWFWVTVALAVLAALVAAGLLLTKQFGFEGFKPVPTGNVEVRTEPQKATIIVDDKQRPEKTNATIKLRTGAHVIKLQLAGYDEQAIQVQVEEKQTVLVDHVFTQGGKSVVKSPPPGQPALQTYTNDRYGYTIQYPHDWSVETESGGVAHFYNAFSTKKLKESPNAEVDEALTILVVANPSGLGPVDWYRSREEYSQEDQSQIKQATITVNGQPGYQYESPYGFSPTVTTIVTGKGQAFLLQQHQGSPDRFIYDEIIQTFKLL